MTTITLPRATVEQALEAMRCAVPTGKITLYEWDKAVSDLSAALARIEWVEPLAQQAEPVEPVAKVIATAPKRIWLDLGFDPADEDITFDQLFEATWSQDNATGWGIEYVRADLVAPPQRKPLTDEDILRVLMLDPPNPSLWPHLKGEAIVGDVQQAVLAIVRAVERALEEKNRGR